MGCAYTKENLLPGTEYTINLPTNKEYVYNGNTITNVTLDDIDKTYTIKLWGILVADTDDEWGMESKKWLENALAQEEYIKITYMEELASSELLCIVTGALTGNIINKLSIDSGMSMRFIHNKTSVNITNPGVRNWVQSYYV